MKYFASVFLLLFTVVAFSGSNQGIGTGSSTGGLSNSELRATPVPVSGTFSVTGALTNTELRASPLSVVSSNIDVALSTRLKPSDTLTGVTTVGSITNPVAITTSSPLSVVSSNLDVALSTRLKPSDTLTGITTVGAVTSITNPVAITTSGALSVVSSNLDSPLSGLLKPSSTLAAITSITNPVAITASTALSVVSSNLDVALSTRLKPADTLTGVTTLGSITSPVSVVSSNLNVALSTLLKPADTLTAVTTVGSITNPVSVVSSKLDVALSTLLKPADTLTAVTTVGTLTNALPAGTNRIGSVRPVDSADADLTSAKSTQTSRALGTQELRDAGRSVVRFYQVMSTVGTTNVETLMVMNQSVGTAATSLTRSYTVTSGKKYRISSITVGSRGHNTATAQTTTFNLRVNTGGACVVSSTPVVLSTRTVTAAVASSYDRITIPFSEGYEIAGDGTLSLCLTSNAVYTTFGPSLDFMIDGYEY